MAIDSEIMPVLSSTSGSNQNEDELSTGLWGPRLETSLLLKLLPFGVIFSTGLGILLNLIILDLNPRLPQKTSLNKWMKFLAIWDVVQNTVLFVLSLLMLLWEEVVNANDVICRTFRYLSTSIALTSSAHLVAMAVDRAVNITFPNWHHKMEFEKMNWKISIFITLFNFATNVLNLFLPGVENGKCSSLSFNGTLPGPILAYQIFVRLVFICCHFGGIISATAVFIYKLRKLRTIDLTEVKREADDFVSRVNSHMNNINTGKQDKIEPRDIKGVTKGQNHVRKRRQVIKDEILNGKEGASSSGGQLSAENFGMNCIPSESSKETKGVEINFNRTTERPVSSAVDRYVVPTVLVSEPPPERSDDLSMDDIIQILSEEQDGPVEAVSLNQMIQMLGEDQPAHNRRPLTLEDLRATCDEANLGSDAPFTMEKVILMIAESHPDPNKLLTIEEIIQALSEYQNKSNFTIQNKKSQELLQNEDRPGCNRTILAAPNQREEMKNWVTSERESFDDANPGETSTIVILSQDDLTAIRTVKWICMWYIFCFCTVFVLFSVSQMVSTGTFSDEKSQVVENMAMMVLTMTSSFNLLFYLSSKSFRAAFKKRYFAEWMYIHPISKTDGEIEMSTRLESSKEHRPIDEETHF